MSEEYKRHVVTADSLERLKLMDENSVDSVVTDPPYELGFMGKSWDSTGIAYRTDLWKEVLRVLKPGGHLLAFGGTRTYHRMATAIEDAGFEIRDQIQWLYGSGFPKSLDIAKAIDRAAGAEPKVVGKRTDGRYKYGFTEQAKKALGAVAASENATGFSGEMGLITEPATDDAKKWQGWGTALKPANEPICMARKPISEATVAANILKWGVGGLNISGTRIEVCDDDDIFAKNPHTKGGFGHGNAQVFGGPGKAEMHYDPSPGRWPSNVILSHTEFCRMVGTTKVKAHGDLTGQKSGTDDDVVYGEYNGKRWFKAYGNGDGTETVETWDCADGCPVSVIDEQSGVTDYKRNEKPSDCGGATWGGTIQLNRGARGHTDAGGASRFFYCAKAKGGEREFGLEAREAGDRKTPMAGRGQPGLRCRLCGKWKASGSPCVCPEPEFEQVAFNAPPVKNHHPTVKPIELMRYLCRLVTPPGGKVLDPFCGSGSTGCATVLEGMDFVGIEKEADYADLATQRIARFEDALRFGIPDGTDTAKVVQERQGDNPLQQEMF